MAVSALKRRREFEEKLALSAALAERFETERDTAQALLLAAERKLLESVPSFVADLDAQKGWVSSATDARAEALRGSISRVFRDVSTNNVDDTATEPSSDKTFRMV